MRFFLVGVIVLHSTSTRLRSTVFLFTFGGAFLIRFSLFISYNHYGILDHGAIVRSGRMSLHVALLPNHVSQKTRQVCMYIELSDIIYLCFFAISTLMQSALLMQQSCSSYVFNSISSLFKHALTLTHLLLNVYYTQTNARSKYCTRTGCVVARFDHQCLWLNTTIGHNNHRTFIVFLVSHLLLCTATLIMLLK